MSKENTTLSVERLHPLGKSGVAFEIKNHTDDSVILFEAAKNDNFPEKASGVVITHNHQDHIPDPEDKNKLFKNIPVVVPSLFEVTAEYAGIDADKLFPKNQVLHEPFAIEHVEGIGDITKLPFSHSSIATDSYVLWGDKQNGPIVFLGSDMRDGDRTTKSSQWLEQNLTGQIDLFIGDATGIGRESITKEVHLTRLMEALLTAQTKQIPTEIYIKPGDVGQIELWLQNNILVDSKVYVTDRLYKFLHKTKLLKRWKETYDFSPEILTDPRAIDHVGNSVFIYDDKYNDPLYKVKTVFVNASRQEPLVHTEHVEAMYLIGLPGHDNVMEKLVKTLKPKRIAMTHPPHKGQLATIDDIPVELGRVGSIIKL